MPVRHVALGIATVLVIGMCVFLLLEVRSSPAAPTAPTAPTAKTDDVERDEPDASVVPEPDRGGDGPPRKIAGAQLRNLARTTGGERTESAGSSPPPAPESTGAEPKLIGAKLDAVMTEANKAYDKQDFEEARAIAQRVLKEHPTNVRMLRIMTSAACIEVDQAEAQKWANLLPEADRAQLKIRCLRYNVTLTDPPK